MRRLTVHCLVSLGDSQTSGVCVRVLGEGSRTQGRYTVKGMWETASLCVFCATRESAFAFERLFCAPFPVGTVINEDINGEIQRQHFP